MKRKIWWFLTKLLKPGLAAIHKLVLQFLKYWAAAPWPTKIAMLPVLALALLFYGFWTFVFGCSVNS